MASRTGEAYWAYVGNYGKAERRGIFLLRFEPAAGTLAWARVAADAQQPNFVIVHPNGRVLYAVTSTKVADYSGAVEAYALDPKSGDLRFLNRQASGGDNPCHLATDPSGKVLIVANYSGGTIAAFPLAADGQLEPASTVVHHRGSSVNPRRQDKAYPHGIMFDRGGRTILVPDLGVDRIFTYDVDVAGGRLTPLELPEHGAMLPPGSGPRHIALSPDERFAYVINELTSTVTAFSYRSPGMLQEIETIAPWPKDEKTSGAEIEVHPNGRYVYASNRGHDSIAVCEIEASTGRLTVRGLVPTGGKSPRHFGLDPTAGFLIASHENSDSMVLFRVQEEGGKLTPTGQVVKAAAPVCVALVAVWR